MKKEIFNRIIDCVSTITEIDKETKIIKTKKSKGIKCKTCQENK